MNGIAVIATNSHKSKTYLNIHKIVSFIFFFFLLFLIYSVRFIFVQSSHFIVYGLCCVETPQKTKQDTQKKGGQNKKQRKVHRDECKYIFYV